MMPSPLSPPPPRAAYFDSSIDAWVLSRYADVLAAFRDPRLWTTTVSGKDQTEGRDQAGKLAARGALQEALSSAKVAEWQTHFEAEVARAVRLLARDRPVDLLREFSLPCCLSLAVTVTGVNAADADRLGELGNTAFAGTGAAAGSEPHSRAAAATSELNRYFENAAQRMGEPTFVGTSQTMARLLANGWLALLGHPEQCRRLRDHPELMPDAVDELLRYAGIVPTLFRRAHAAVAIGDADIQTGQRVHLMIASANRDPEQFPDPDRLDIARRAVNHLALGNGRNSCVGMLVIRMAAAATTGALLREFPRARLVGETAWESSASFCWPAGVKVMLEPRET
jgi:cytochrome P450